MNGNSKSKKRVGIEIPGSENIDKFSGVRKRARPLKAVGRCSEHRSRPCQRGVHYNTKTRREARVRSQGTILRKLPSLSLGQLETVKQI